MPKDCATLLTVGNQRIVIEVSTRILAKTVDI